MNRTSIGAMVAVPMLVGATVLGSGSATAAGAPVVSTSAASASAGFADGTYIVQMRDLPVASYDGTMAGYSATKAKPGKKFDSTTAAATKYASYLTGAHDAALSKVGGASKLYDYLFSFNGFAAKLTGAQAASLAKTAGVVAVTPQELIKADTSSSPSFLGLDDPTTGGLWTAAGGNLKGEGVIIGIIDSGIWPESLSFTDRVDANGNPAAQGFLAYQQIPGWHGKCTPGEGFNASMCNQKLIGAQYFNAAWGGNAGIAEEEFASPRDFGGHGTHTASTSGGNANVPTTQDAAPFGAVSGIAPRARIAAYKALWETPSGGSGFNSDLVAAIDRAVADGVDVINYSVSGTSTNFADPVEIAFLFAADAGVFVAASAGNSGPATSTVAHPAPWTTTVAAGTHNRNGEGSVTLGNGATYTGASFASQTGPAPLIDSIAAGVAGADPTNLALCVGAADGEVTLDPAKVAGKIVVCQRGVTARVNKSLAVKEAGGIGMILFNSPDSSLNADFHFVPTVHVDNAAGQAIKTYAATAGATATINASTVVYNAPAPLTASFSSRGPLIAGAGDLLKPDIIAPGQDILASVAPPGNSGRDFDIYSGTSMSAPHMAGLAALLKQAKPAWSPMAIKSAFMTTAGDVLDGPNTNPLVIFRQGAGHVRPNSATDPGLVFDSAWNHWLAFLCGTSAAVGPATCDLLTSRGYSTDPSDFNSASVAIGALAGKQTVTRTVTNVGKSSATYTLSTSGLAGITVAADPATFTVAPGSSKTVKLTFTRTTAALNAYAGGQLTWTDGSHQVRIPAVIRPVALSAPTQVNGAGAAITYPVGFGYTGDFSATPRGLIPAVTTAGHVLDDPSDLFSPTGSGVTAHVVEIPAGTTYARFSLFDDFVDGATDDLDLYVYQGSARVGSSGNGTSAEEVNLVNPAPGTYTVYVHGWGTDGPDANYTLFQWLLGTADAGNMTISAPASATTGGSGTVSLSFTGLSPATKYLGSVAYSGSTGMPNPTIVRVDTP
jgi:subtilisin family serine protease